eukprot:TRINITY_DN8050_c0_g1_i3.p1 TRINITY_DN8050_c0_g1~~TRINITY_DN8050_c0_g1_i3.p1  ORF type:complete len:704 (+),score=138.80 TRINITY_DN8050_c0_g1_i3:70-2181(+)
MKHFAFVSTALAASTFTANAVQHMESQISSESPIETVVSLMRELTSRLEADGRSEQTAYDKFACWCEATLGQKATEITGAKDDISKLETSIVKLTAEIATHGAEVKNLDKSIAANVASQREATEIREKEAEQYRSEKLELEQNIGALDAAIKVLSGAGAGKKGFLETLQEAQVLSVVAGLRSVLRHSTVNQLTSAADLAVVKHFVDKPEEFVGGGSSALSAVQIAQNPFGDYAPQSSQIQGILKSMHDAFSADLEKSIAEEAQQKKSFEDLMATWKSEHATLESSLEQHTLAEADKTKEVSVSRQMLDDTKAQLDADEIFFSESKTACKAKASEWATRTRLRTQEMHGINRAIEILSSESAVKTFNNASSTSLLQLEKHGGSRGRALETIAGISIKHASASIARVKEEIRAGGHFDDVIHSINAMIDQLRREEQEDIEHRDRCQTHQKKNEYDISDASSGVSSADSALGRMDGTKTGLLTQLAELNTKMNATRSSLDELVALRIEDNAQFIQSLKDDSDAVKLLDQAILVLSRVYSNGQSGAVLLHVGDDPNSTATSPPATWKGDYGGRSSEGTGIVSILSMIKEDFEKEIKTSRVEEASAQKDFEEQRKTLSRSEKAQKAAILSLEGQIADLEKTMLDKEDSKKQLQADKDNGETLKAALETDCAWVETHFDSRRQKRQSEIEGLTDAKNYLAGVEAGTELS